MKVFKICIILGLVISITACSNIHKKNEIEPQQEIKTEKINFDTTNLGELFEKENGCILIKKIGTDEVISHNSELAKTAFSPYSTFKIPHALIALEEKVIDKDTKLKWDKTVHYYEQWNKDTDLESGIKNSVVWFFKEVARKIGPEKMQNNLNKINYGNKDISGGIDNFWLTSSLKLNSYDQIHFLEELYNESLPFSKENMKIVKNMMYIDTIQGTKLYGKTGSGNKKVGGWFVGYFIYKDTPYVFASYVKEKTGLDIKEKVKEFIALQK